MPNHSTTAESVRSPGGAGAPLCWICNQNEANSGEHKTKRSDLLAALGNPTQEEPFYYHDLEQRNRPVKSLDAKILKAPIRICADCNTTRTQPHDRSWEQMSKWLRERQQPLKIGGLVRANRIFPQSTRRGCRRSGMPLAGHAACAASCRLSHRPPFVAATELSRRS